MTRLHLITHRMGMGVVLACGVYAVALDVTEPMAGRMPPSASPRFRPSDGAVFHRPHASRFNRISQEAFQ